MQQVAPLLVYLQAHSRRLRKAHPAEGASRSLVLPLSSPLSSTDQSLVGGVRPFVLPLSACQVSGLPGRPPSLSRAWKARTDALGVRLVFTLPEPHLSTCVRGCERARRRGAGISISCVDDKQLPLLIRSEDNRYPGWFWTEAQPSTLPQLPGHHDTRAEADASFHACAQVGDQRPKESESRTLGEKAAVERERVEASERQRE